MNRPISIVILAHNTAATIEKVANDYYKIVEKIPGSEFVIAEDGSTDGTKEILSRVSKKIPIKLILGKERKGYAEAMKDAFRRTKNDLIFFTDSDDEFYAEDFWKLYPYSEDYDLVLGYRDKRKPLIRFVLSRVNNIFIGLLFGVWLKDANCPFRIIRKGIVDRFIERAGIAMHPNGEFTVLAKKYGYKIKEVGVRHKMAGSEFFSLRKAPKIIIKTIKYQIRLKRSL